MPVLRVDPHEPGRAAVERAAEVLRAGGLVAFPTETVYGLGADALDAAAVRRVFAAKGRPADNPLIVHLSEPDEMTRVAADVTPLARRLAELWWPGPLTLVLSARPAVPAVTTGGLATVAVRLPDHAVARALVAAAGIPIAAPSANRSGRPSPTTAAHVLDDLGGCIDLVLDAGPCRVGLESTVVDARGAVPQILREGSITREQLGASVAAGDLGASPGTRHRHYQPRCRVVLAAPGAGPAAAAREGVAGARVGLVAARRRTKQGLVERAAVAPGTDDVEVVLRYDDVEALAVGLYGALRAAEERGVDVLVVEGVEDAGLGRAVMDRLRRAAALT